MAAMERPAEWPMPGRWIEPEDISKADLIARLRELQEARAISWFIAGERPFDWAEANLDSERFIDEVRRLDFGTARMSSHVPGKGGRYSLFRVAG